MRLGLCAAFLISTPKWGQTGPTSMARDSGIRQWLQCATSLRSLGGVVLKTGAVRTGLRGTVLIKAEAAETHSAAGNSPDGDQQNTPVAGVRCGVKIMLLLSHDFIPASPTQP